MRLSAAEVRFALGTATCLLIRPGRLSALPVCHVGVGYWVAEPQEVYRLQKRQGGEAPLMRVRYLADGTTSPWMPAPGTRLRVGQSVPFGGMVRTARLWLRVRAAWEMTAGELWNELDRASVAHVAPGPVSACRTGHLCHEQRIERLLAAGPCTIINVERERTDG